MVRSFRAAALFLALVCLLLAAWALCGPPGPPRGGAAPRRRGPDPALSPHLVVDTLNLTHWLRRDVLKGGGALTPELIVETVDEAAPVLKARHKGKLYFVLKDRESQLNDGAARDAYQAAATRNGVYLSAAERYADPPSTGVKATAEHSARGRDDFYMAVLARRLRCAVLTEDRLRDFDRFRATIQPFHVVEFAYWRARPEREYVRPESPAFAQMRKPRMVRYADYFGER